MIDKKDQKRWDEPELDKAQAESDAIFAEMEGLKRSVENGDTTILQAQSRFIELLERHRLIGERLLAVSRAWALHRATPRDDPARLPTARMSKLPMSAADLSRRGSGRGGARVLN